MKVSSVRLQGLVQLLFVRMLHLPFIRDIQTDFTRTGLGGTWVSKGCQVGVVVSFLASTSRTWVQVLPVPLKTGTTDASFQHEENTETAKKHM